MHNHVHPTAQFSQSGPHWVWNLIAWIWYGYGSSPIFIMQRRM